MPHANVFERKRRRVLAQVTHERVGHVVAAVATVGISAAEHKKRGRVIDDDVAHVPRLGE